MKRINNSRELQDVLREQHRVILPVEYVEKLYVPMAVMDASTQIQYIELVKTAFEMQREKLNRTFKIDGISWYYLSLLAQKQGKTPQEFVVEMIKQVLAIEFPIYEAMKYILDVFSEVKS